MRKGNKVLRSGFNDISKNNEDPMTINGTVIKILILLVFLMTSALFTWNQFMSGNESFVMTAIIGGSIFGFVIALITTFKPQISMFTSPLYALAQGVVLGGISANFNDMYNGIVIQAVLITIALLISMLFVYKTGIIKVTKKFRSGILMATFGIMIVYIINLVLSLMGFSLPFLHDTGMIGLLISLFIIGIATLNLLIDFDFIERAVANNYPKYMEWYGAFGLMVTLVWLYLEILRILQRLSNK